MEGCSRNKETNLDFIPKEREWIGRRNEGRFEVSEDKKLELRLGPPGEDWRIEENNISNRRERDESLLSLAFFTASREFSDTVELKTGDNHQPWTMNNNGDFNQKLASSENSVFSSPWSSSGSSSAFMIKTQNQPNPSFLPFSSVQIQTRESSKPCSTKVVELQNPDKKPSSSVPADTVMPNTSQKRTAPASVVGWPPIRSFRKNLASSSSSKPALESQKIAPNPTNVSINKAEISKKGLFVKINMDGVPIGRKVDLTVYESYEKLSSAVDELFRDLLAAQRDSSGSGNWNKNEEVKAITGLLDGNGEYTLVYEDNEGDRMLVGDDVPWHMFVSTVKRLRVLESSKLSAFCLGSSSEQEKTPLDSGGR